MKNIKQKLRRSVLYLLGFSAFPMLTSCYGMPADYQDPPPPLQKIKGKVVTKDNKPIHGILISYTTADENYPYPYEVRSSVDGTYTVLEREKITQVIFSDIDGVANGGDFEQQSKTIDEIKANGEVVMKLKNEN